MSFEPLYPFGNTNRIHWANEIQDAVYRSRRMLVTPDTLTYQTTQGVFHRPKPCDCVNEVTTQIIYENEFDFKIVWVFQTGGAGDPKIVELSNAEVYSMPKQSGVGTWWNGQSGFRLTRKIKYPYYVSQIFATRTPASPLHEQLLGGSNATDLAVYTNINCAIGSDKGYEFRNALGNLQPEYDLGTVYGLPAQDMQIEQPFVFQFGADRMPNDNTDHYYGGRLHTYIVVDPLVDLVRLKQYLADYIPPGTEFKIEGQVRRYIEPPTPGG